jgi:hypothetical protein
VKILGISGSLRKGSFNTALLRAAVDLMPEGVAARSRDDLRHPACKTATWRPRKGSRPAVQALKDRIVQAEGLPAGHARVQQFDPRPVQERDRLAFPAVLRHRQGVRRPAGRRNRRLTGRFRHHPGAERLAAGAPHARDAHWFGGRLQVSRAGNVFNPAGELTDEAIRAQLRKYLAGFVDFIRNKAPAAEIRRCAAGATMPAWEHTTIGFIPSDWSSSPSW